MPGNAWVNDSIGIDASIPLPARRMQVGVAHARIVDVDPYILCPKVPTGEHEWAERISPRSGGVSFNGIHSFFSHATGESRRPARDFAGSSFLMSGPPARGSSFDHIGDLFGVRYQRCVTGRNGD